MAASYKKTSCSFQVQAFPRDMLLDPPSTSCGSLACNPLKVKKAVAPHNPNLVPSCEPVGPRGSLAGFVSHDQGGSGLQELRGASISGHPPPSVSAGTSARDGGGNRAPLPPGSHIHGVLPPSSLHQQALKHTQGHGGHFSGGSSSRTIAAAAAAHQAPSSPSKHNFGLGLNAFSPPGPGYPTPTSAPPPPLPAAINAQALAPPPPPPQPTTQQKLAAAAQALALAQATAGAAPTEHQHPKQELAANAAGSLLAGGFDLSATLTHTVIELVSIADAVTRDASTLMQSQQPDAWRNAAARCVGVASKLLKVAEVADQHNAVTAAAAQATAQVVVAAWAAQEAAKVQQNMEPNTAEKVKENEATAVRLTAGVKNDGTSCAHAAAAGQVDGGADALLPPPPPPMASEPAPRKMSPMSFAPCTHIRQEGEDVCRLCKATREVLSQYQITTDPGTLASRVRIKFGSSKEYRRAKLRAGVQCMTDFFDFVRGKQPQHVEASSPPSQKRERERERDDENRPPPPISFDKGAGEAFRQKRMKHNKDHAPVRAAMSKRMPGAADEDDVEEDLKNELDTLFMPFVQGVHQQPTQQKLVNV